MILTNFKPKYYFGHFYFQKQPKIYKSDDFGCKISSKFEENSKINIYSLVPKIDHPVALCVECLFVCYVNICCTWKFAKSFLIQKGSIFFLILKNFDVFWLQNLFHFFNAITIFARKPLKFFFLQEPIVSISHIAHKPVINYGLP